MTAVTTKHPQHSKLTLCIVLSLAICFGITPLFNKYVSQKTEIVRVTKEIKAGDEITKDMVQMTEADRERSEPASSAEDASALEDAAAPTAERVLKPPAESEVH